MIVDDLHVMRLIADPAETDPPLVVDANAMLSEAIGRELLQMVRGRNSEVGEACCGVQDEQLSKNDSMKVRRQPSDPFSFEKSFRVWVAKASNHKA